MTRETTPSAADLPAHPPGVEASFPDPIDGCDTWVRRHSQALVDWRDAKWRAEQRPGDEDLARVALAAEERLAQIKVGIGTELCFMLRKTDDYHGEALRSLLTAVIGDVVDGLLNEFRNDVAELADKVVRLERKVGGR